MKKLLALLTIFLLPLGVIADVLPEPNNLNFDDTELITENMSEEDVVYSQESIDESDTQDESIESNESDETNDTDENLQEVNVTANEISEDSGLHEIGADGGLTRVSFGYCNEGIDNPSRTLNYAINQGEPFKVCFIMSNSANQDIKVRIRMVDLLNGICSVNSTTIYNFISPDDIKDFDEITIPAGNYIIKEFNILYPVGIEGDQGACTMFNIIKEEESTANISAIVNRAYPMQFFVGTLDNVKNEIAIENVELTLDDNKDLIMNFDIKNKGNLENLVELSGTVSNIFGYSKKFSIEGGHVLPGGLWHVTANLGSIPSYGGLFNIDFKAYATPYFSYDISKSSIDPSLIEMKTFDFKTTYFKMPRIIFAIIIILILLIITMIRKPKEKVVYIQAPQQPAQPQQPQYQQPQYQQPQYQQPTQPQQPQYQQPQQPTPNQYTPNA